MLDLRTTPGHLVRRAQQVHTALWSERLHGELTGPQYAVLQVVARRPGIDQTSLGDLASLDKNTATDIVRRLSDKGWVERSADAEDRRKRRLRLTASAKMAMRYITPAAAQVQVDLLAPLSQRARRLAVPVLAEVAFARGARPFDGGSSDVPVLEMATSPGYLLRRIQQEHGSLWAELVGPDLTGPQYAVLAALAHRPGLDQLSVGRLASLDRSSTADVVARLVRSGWLVSRAHPNDGRRSALCLSEAAPGRLARVTPLVGEVQTRLLGPLDTAGAATFTSTVTRIAFRPAPRRSTGTS